MAAQDIIWQNGLKQWSNINMALRAKDLCAMGPAVQCHATNYEKSQYQVKFNSNISVDSSLNRLH